MPPTLHPLATAASLAMMLGACGEPSYDQSRQPLRGTLADCAIGSGASWKRECAVEREKDILTLRHADGGFRRLKIVNDGRGLMTADGAEEARVVILDKALIEVSVEQDRYRLPASITEGPAR